jgi:adenine-specific DNA-methyltransferase
VSRVEIIGPATLYLGDCMDIMRGMEPNSVDAIITDPPYYKVKGEEWDNQWDTPAEFLAWIAALCEQFERILKPNGSLYLFASPQMAARVEIEIGRRFNTLASIVWRKGISQFAEVGRGNASSKESLRSFWQSSERIIFAEHYGADNIAKGESGYEAKCDELRGFVFEPLRAYLDGERIRAGFDRAMCDKACGNQMSGHYFSRVQWTLPTLQNYEKLRSAFNETGGEDLRREYEDLRREYEDLRRPFNVTARDQWSDVWEFDPVGAYPGKHPCEKPLPLLCHMLTASTRPGSVIFDPFLGSGSMAHSCLDLGRQFIGAERCPDNFAKAVQRVKHVASQERLFA